MIENGWRIQIDADDNLFYIDPQTNRVLDINNDDRGEWSPITGEIEFLTHTDARAPIGIGTGAFGTAAEGVLNTNAVGDSSNDISPEMATEMPNMSFATPSSASSFS